MIRKNNCNDGWSKANCGGLLCIIVIRFVWLYHNHRSVHWSKLIKFHDVINSYSNILYQLQNQHGNNGFLAVPVIWNKKIPENFSHAYHLII